MSEIIGTSEAYLVLTAAPGHVRRVDHDSPTGGRPTGGEEQIMSVRTTETAVTFRRPFALAAFDDLQPAGTYRLTIDEEEIAGLSFAASRRTATILHLPAISVSARLSEAVPVDAAELAAALDLDARA